MPQSALAARHGKGKREKHAAIIHVSVCDQVCVSVCVCLHVCNTMVSLHMKIWERFCLKLKSRISNCLPLVSMDDRSPTSPGNSFFVFCCKNVYIYSVYIYTY